MDLPRSSFSAGRVLDPKSGLDERADVVVADGLICAVGPDLAHAFPGADIVDCTDLLVSPGLIDLRVHVYPGLGDFCVHPDRAGVEVAVAIVVDGGTSGVATFGVARARAEAPDVRSKVLALMDPCLLYLATKSSLPHRLQAGGPARRRSLRSCIAECPVDCIYEGGRRLYIQPYECIDCGACEPVCPVDAITAQGYGGPDGSVEVAQNLEFFNETLAGRVSALGSPGSGADVGALDSDPARVLLVPVTTH